MRHGQEFRFTRYAMGIAEREGRHDAILVPEGALIEVMGGPFDGSRLMEVRFKGEIILMFTDDMKTHTERLKVETA